MKRDIVLIVLGFALLLVAVMLLGEPHRGNPFIQLAGSL